MNLKVIHVTSHLKTGGAENLITDYAIKLHKDIEVVLIIIGSSNNSINEQKLRNLGIKIIFLGERKIFSKKKNFITKIVNKLYSYLIFIKTIKNEKPNIIHGHLSATKYLAFVNTKKLGINLFYTVHAEVDRLFRKERYIFKCLTKYCIKKNDMVPIALHPKMQKDVNKLFNTNKCIVLNNGIDMKRFNPLNYDKKNIKKSLGISEDTFVIGHVGRLVEAKNHKFIINIFNNIKIKKPNTKLLLVGSGELKYKIKKQVIDLGLEKDVILLGERSNVPELMRVMDVFLFPSISEGFGNVLIEAQAMGLKCVVSNKVPKDAFITNLVTPLGLDESIEVWSKHILEYKPDNEINRSKLKEYDIDQVVRKLKNLYVNARKING